MVKKYTRIASLTLALLLGTSPLFVVAQPKSAGESGALVKREEAQPAVLPKQDQEVTSFVNGMIKQISDFAASRKVQVTTAALALISGLAMWAYLYGQSQTGLLQMPERGALRGTQTALEKAFYSHPAYTGKYEKWQRPPLPSN